jgi:hypothetical protein
MSVSNTLYMSSFLQFLNSHDYRIRVNLDHLIWSRIERSLILSSNFFNFVCFV